MSCLEKDEEVGGPFTEIVKKMFPDSLKKGSRQQNRLQERKSRP